ncbi:MAG: hypothetical protein LBI11_03485 [Streptococcaceae bacterium]|nr:hypothetical protein [Streptococcaceae bacterium]
MNLGKWAELNRYITKRKSIANIAVSALISYYKGDFENNINKLTSNQILIIQAKNDSYKFFTLICLYKCAVMTKNEKLMEQSRLELEKINFKNASKEKWRQNTLNFCHMMQEILVLEKSSELIDSWRPQYPGGKINLLEKMYFQALNERLKNNEIKSKEYFQELSTNDAKIYFVKEAKKYLEEENGK